MAKQIDCPCGYVVEGASDAELLTNARAHIQDKHPDMTGTSDEDILAMAKEA